VKGIPGFWLTCLTSHPSTGEIVTEEDVPALECLTDITCKYDDAFTSFTLTFSFSENEFFTNKVRAHSKITIQLLFRYVFHCTTSLNGLTCYVPILSCRS
jgi:hypothetical protein